MPDGKETKVQDLIALRHHKKMARKESSEVHVLAEGASFSLDHALLAELVTDCLRTPKTRLKEGDMEVTCTAKYSPLRQRYLSPAIICLWCLPDLPGNEDFLSAEANLSFHGAPAGRNQIANSCKVCSSRRAENYILLQLKSCFRDVKLSVDQEMLREEKRTKFFPFVSRSTSRPESGLEATTQGEAAL
ncbi:hypothetical protein Q9966_014572 [Columba livia]|nr:hypothetical protein Q9966_014572 [Columba livia]